ncbi:hypothetical protein [Alteribacter populi]|uniref:hypothetical protein n=1 Tax=Alteribacter populi TaxID=2011011 RepID=UPI000BBAD257|nr:hypothetical protein [Alteribacter populi]
MIEIEKLNAAYGFETGEWIQKGEKLKTERGNKIVRFWDQQQVMNWHIQWREAFDNQGVCLTNRMIRTVDGDMAFLYSEGWLTLHDEVTSLFSYQNKEAILAEFVRGILHVGTKMDDSCAHNPTLTEEKIVDCLKECTTNQDPIVVNILKKTLDEAVTRFQKAEKLTLPLKTKAIVIDPLFSLDAGKEIYGQLFWEFQGSQPEKGYKSLAYFLSDCLQRLGSKSFKQLLTSLEKVEGFRDKTAICLLREALMPWDFIESVDRINKAVNQEKSYVYLEAMYRQWEASRAFVTVLSQWLDGKREKVAN